MYTFWTELPNSYLINNIFSTPPKIGDINLTDIDISLGQPSIIISFDLIDMLPDNPPKKWGSSFNRCSLGISCSAVSELNISKYPIQNRNTATISFSKEKNNYLIGITGEEINIILRCNFISLVGPAVYMKN